MNQGNPIKLQGHCPFVTPITQFDLSCLARVNDYLRSVIKVRMTRPSLPSLCYLGDWQSNANLLKLNGTCARKSLAYGKPVGLDGQNSIGGS